MSYIDAYPDCEWMDFETLERFMVDALKGEGVPEEDAQIAAEVLITSDKRGIDSHGIGRLKPIYIDRMAAGTQNPITKIDVIKETQTTAVLDGNNGLGHVIAKKANSMAIVKAKKIWHWYGDRAQLHPLRHCRLLCAGSLQSRVRRHERHQRPAVHCPHLRR